MTDLTATLSAVGTLKATLGAGKINVNDYTLTVEPTENGTEISITRGSQTDTVFVPDYAEDEERRVTNENTRITNERSRETAEYARDTEEAKRQTAEAGRVTAEDARADAETKRTDAETARATAEAGRDAAETARVEAEGKRVTAEGARETAEAGRVTAEEKRVDAETARAAAETSRVSAESARATAEDARAKAESQRQTDTAAAISKADAAAESAQSVADTVQAKLDAGELDGYSPSASVTQTDTGATISITDKSGTSTADVKNGSDASVTKDNIVGALGYTPAIAEDKYELLNTITTTESVTKVVVNADSSGNALRLAHMYCKLYTDGTWTSTKSGSTYVHFGKQPAYIYPSVAFYNDTKCYTAAIAHAYGSRKEYQHNAYDTRNDAAGALVNSKTYVKVTPDDTSPITGFMIYNGAGVPAGAIIEIYGIRA